MEYLPYKCPLYWECDAVRCPLDNHREKTIIEPEETKYDIVKSMIGKCSLTREEVEKIREDNLEVWQEFVDRIARLTS